MSFIDSFKRLEKLCNEIYGGIHGVKAYIDEMTNTPMGARYVSGWDEDLKTLKHLNWVRNRISHDPDCNENNMCEPGDEEWIIAFRERIMMTTDPLSLYRKARNPQSSQKAQHAQPSVERNTYPQGSKPSKQSAGCLTYIIGALLLVAVAALIISII